MARYRGDIEQARKELRALGHSPKEARDRAPRLAARQQEVEDQQLRPFSWLGGKSNDRS